MKSQKAETDYMSENKELEEKEKSTHTILVTDETSIYAVDAECMKHKKKGRK